MDITERNSRVRLGQSLVLAVCIGVLSAIGCNTGQWNPDLQALASGKDVRPQLTALLACQKVELPEWVRLPAEDRSYFVHHVQDGYGNEFVVISVVVPSPFENIDGILDYCLVLDSRLKVLGHFEGGERSSGVRGVRLGDINADGFLECVTAYARPEVQRPISGPEKGRRFTVWQLRETRLLKLLDVLYRPLLATGEVRTVAVYVNEGRVYLATHPERPLAVFEWRSAAHVYLGPAGGPCDLWEVLPYEPRRRE